MRLLNSDREIQEIAWWCVLPQRLDGVHTQVRRENAARSRRRRAQAARLVSGPALAAGLSLEVSASAAATRDKAGVRRTAKAHRRRAPRSRPDDSGTPRDEPSPKPCAHRRSTGSQPGEDQPNGHDPEAIIRKIGVAGERQRANEAPKDDDGNNALAYPPGYHAATEGDYEGGDGGDDAPVQGASSMSVARSECRG